MALDSLRSQLRILPTGFEKPQHFDMRETRWAWADYSIDIEPGDFGVFVPGEKEELAFRRVDNSAANKSALFEYQSWNGLYARNYAEFDVVCEHPKTYVIDFA